MVETMVSTPGSSGRESAPSKPPGHSGSESGLTSAATNQETRFSRTAIVGACWAPLFLGAFAGFYAAGFLAVPLICLGATAPFGTTLLGWAAVSQIRRSAVRVRGLWLALLDGLLFPLLSLDALVVGGVWLGIVAYLTNPSASGAPDPGKAWTAYWWIIFAAAFISMLVDYLIIRRVWRAVNKPVDGKAKNDESPAPNTDKAGRGRKTKTVLAGTAILPLS